jgi:hypothetical protein
VDGGLTAAARNARATRSGNFWRNSVDAEGDKIRKLKRGLWDNVHAKRARGEAPAKPGHKDYPDPKQWRKLSGQRG